MIHGEERTNEGTLGGVCIHHFQFLKPTPTQACGRLYKPMTAMLGVCKFCRRLCLLTRRELDEMHWSFIPLVKRLCRRTERQLDHPARGRKQGKPSVAPPRFSREESV